MRRWQKIGSCLLAVCALFLSAANLTLRAEACPAFRVAPTQVERILVYSFNTADPDVLPQRHAEPAWEISNPEDIQRVCGHLADMRVFRYPAERTTPEQSREATRLCSYRSYEFVLHNGEIRRIDLSRCGLVYFDGLWCYATGGESDDYLPVHVLLGRVTHLRRQVQR